MGHPGMQARADTIGAELQYIDVPEGGTRVQLVFKLQNRPA